MKGKRARQLQLTFVTEAIVWVPKDKEQELLSALAELLLAGAKEGDDDERGQGHERQDHG